MPEQTPTPAAPAPLPILCPACGRVLGHREYGRLRVAGVRLVYALLECVHCGQTRRWSRDHTLPGKLHRPEGG